MAAHLAAHRPVPPPASRRLAPLIPLAAAAVAALAIGGVAWVLPWLALVGTSVWARRLLARRLRRQRRVERAGELVRLRFNRPALRTAWRLLPELTEHPGLHHAAVSVLARGLEQTLETDAALTCLDHLTDAVPKGHPARAALDARRIAALVDCGRLADADAALRRLRSADGKAPEHHAVRALAELEHAVATAHYHEAIEESPTLIQTLRPLGLGAARGYALRALCHHHRDAAGDHAARELWWARATALIDADTLIAALPATAAVANDHTDAGPNAMGELPSSETPRDPGDTPPRRSAASTFTPQRLRRELAADRWLRRSVLLGLPAAVLTAGIVTAWPLPVALLSAIVVLTVGGAALLLLQAPVMTSLPAVAPLSESAPPAAAALLSSLTRRRGLNAPLRCTLYHHATALLHRRDTPSDRAAAAALATELLAQGPSINTLGPAAAVATSGPRAALLLIVADAHLSAGHPAHAWPALAELAHTAVSLDQGLERLTLQTRYALAIGAHALAITHARAKADLGALMPVTGCRRLHRALLAAAQAADDSDATAWLARRVALLG